MGDNKQLMFFEQPAPGGEEGVVAPLGMKRYAVVKKTYPARRTERPMYAFLILLITWNTKKERLERQARCGGPRYELITTIDQSSKQLATARAREMFPDLRVLCNEEI